MRYSKLVVFFISLTEAPPRALDIIETSAELNSAFGSLGKFNSIKKPFCASSSEALLFSGTLLAVKIPDNVSNSMTSESILPDVKRVCAAANVACPQRITYEK